MSLVLSEFDCPCCGMNKMKQGTFNRFAFARELAGVPFVITSGCRCEKHNIEIDGKEDSSHLKCEAGDIACAHSWYRWKIVNALKDAGFIRIGIGKDFIHADTDTNKPQGVLWLYPLS